MGVNESSTMTSASCLVQMSSADLNSNLIFFPDYGGNTHYSRGIVQKLGGKYSTYSLRLPEDIVGCLHEMSIEDVARRLADNILAARLSGSVHFLGYSFAGLLAYETARQMAKQGNGPTMLWLLDTVATRKLNTQDVLRHPLYHIVAMKRFVRCNWRRIALGQKNPLILSAYGIKNIDLSKHPESYRYIIRSLYTAMISYDPEISEVPTTLLRAKDRSDSYALGRDLRWGKVAIGPFRVVSVPGDHLSMLRDTTNASVVSEKIFKGIEHGI
jgi:thioesterase domain-containing protein